MGSIRLIESLEGRRMFAAGAVLDGRVLVLTGTSRQDVITVTGGGSTVNGFQVRVNGQVTEFLTADVSSIHIEAYGGNDFIDVSTVGVMDGIVRIWGHAGDDWIVSGQAHMTSKVWGGAGNDTIKALTRRDSVYGGEGNDTVAGGVKPDLIFGDDGNDLLFGGWGLDYINGGAGDDRIFGGAGNDHCFGGDGNDVVWGAEGTDDLHGGAGTDLLRGGPDTDTFDGEPGEGRDVTPDEVPIS